ncbi:MAG: hypothetical protein J1E59_00035 [Treponema sp.]|nr:hypothetical protein [Treponema sp.]
MSKDALEKVNKRLLQHFKETGVENAYYYAPVDDHYWQKTATSKRVAFCNLEPYTRGHGDVKQGYVLLDKETLYESWFYTRTSGKVIAMNYCLSKVLYDGEEISESDIRTIVLSRGHKEDELWEDFDYSLYFNFRHTCSKTVRADTAAIARLYNDPFYCQHYRDFVAAAEIDILIVGGKYGCNLLNKIYPDLHLQYKGKPAKYDGRIFVSMKHPSRISYADMVETIYDIADAVYKK